jgi:hypothetical protein
MKQLLSKLKTWLKTTWDDSQVEPNFETPNITVPRHLINLPTWINSEIIEYQEALRNGDMVGVIDAIADIQYLSMQLIVIHGLENSFELFFDEVHRSNMTKVRDGVLRDATRKIRKPEGYEPPNIKEILKKVLSEQEKKYFYLPTSDGVLNLAIKNPEYYKQPSTKELKEVIEKYVSERNNESLETQTKPNYYLSKCGRFDVADMMYLYDLQPAIAHAITYAMRVGQKDTTELELRKIIRWLDIQERFLMYAKDGIGSDLFFELLKEDSFTEQFDISPLSKSIVRRLVEINSHVKNETKPKEEIEVMIEKLKFFINAQIAALHK